MEPLTRESWRRYQFTPGSERAFEFAEAWESSAGSNEIRPAELLCGLLAERECRAARLLADRGVDEAAVLARWPELSHAARISAERHKQFSSEVQAALRTAYDLLREYEQPVAIATEHLLLGLAALPGEVSRWLAQRGVAADEIEAEVHRLAGHDPHPLPIEPEELASEPSASNRSEAPPTAPEPIDSPRDEASLGENPPTDNGAIRTPAKDFDPETAPELPIVESPLVEPGSGLSQAGPDAAGGALTSSSGSSGALALREEAGVWRIIDAAANRAGEGLRVVEDYVRFALDDRRLLADAKQLRHDLAAVLARTTPPARHVARDVSRDVGATLSTTAEGRRESLWDVAMANCKRAQQALRSLEEYSKIVAPAAAAAFERLRYRSYTLEQSVALAGDRFVRLAAARLYVLADGQSSPTAFGVLVDTLVRAEVDVIQLRDKRLPDRILLDRAQRLAAATRGGRTLFIMNDRPDLAVLAGADGVHVGQDELTVAQARAIVGRDALVGVSTHSLEQARAAVADGADYIGVGPTFPSRTKYFDAFVGLELARAVAGNIPLPAFAIGGIDAANVGQVIAAGLRRVAVGAAVTEAADPFFAAREIKAALC